MNLFRNIYLPSHILLLSLAILSRLPLFIFDNLLPQEAMLLLCGEKLASGGSLYLDAWIEGPPIMAWLYSGLSFVFGDAVLSATRVISVLYIYFLAVWFQGLLVNYEVVSQKQVLPGVLLILITALPWYAQGINLGITLLLPLLFSFHSMLHASVHKGSNHGILFTIGLIMMLAILIDYSAIVFLLGMFFLYLLNHAPKIGEFITIMMGVLTCLALFLLILYFNNSLSEFWQMGVVYYYSHFFSQGSEPFLVNPFSQAWHVLFPWIVLIFTSIGGLVYYRLYIFRQAILVRRIESMMFIWLLCGLLIIFFSARRMRLDDFVLLAPPLIFYAAKVFYLDIPQYTKIGLFSLVFLPAALGFIPSQNLPAGPIRTAIPSNPYALSSAKQALLTSLKKQGVKDIWVLGFEPQLYIKGEMECRNPYTDYRVVYRRFPYFSNASSWDFNKEPDAQIFQVFQKNPPAAIIDLESQFPKIKDRFPSIFSMYKLENKNGLEVWTKVSSPI